MYKIRMKYLRMIIHRLIVVKMNIIQAENKVD